MSTLAILCSGQGWQGSDMFDLVAGAPEAQDVFAAAGSVFNGRDPRDLVAQATDGELHANATAQVLCCTQALAAWSVLRPKLQARLVVAGYSVGEVAAWGVAGAFDPATAFQVVARRAALMDGATRPPAGLLAIRGLMPRAIEGLCRDVGVYVAIRNAPDRVVLGGGRDALERARTLAERGGAAGVTHVPVGVASHTPLLRGAAEEFSAFLVGLEGVRVPEARLISGIDGASVFDAREGLAKLGRQVAETVDWAACMVACRAVGATRALELGPGNALARMMGEVIGDRDCRSVAEFRSIDGVLRWALA